MGLLLALISAAAFGTSGSLARAMLDLGWSPVAVVAVRMGGAFFILLVPCLLQLRRTGLPSLRQGRRMAAYGLFAVAMAQVCFFSAVQYLSVGVALLLEYTAPVLLIGYFWVRDRRRPAYAVLVGAGLALVGLVFVLDVADGLTLNPIGVLWGLAAAVGLAGYFVLADHAGEDSVHPLVLTTGGTGVGALLVLLVGLTGFLPFTAATGTTTLAGAAVPWWLPLLLLMTVAAALSYFIGILAVRRLGSSVASFVSLTEVIFAVVFAIVLLGQQPSGVQVFGGLLVLAGIAVVQRGSVARSVTEDKVSAKSPEVLVADRAS